MTDSGSGKPNVGSRSGSGNAVIDRISRQRGKHRAMYQLRLSRRNILFTILLPLLFNALIFLMIDPLIGFWRMVLTFGVERLNFGARVIMQPFDLGIYDLWIPTVAIRATLPSLLTWWVTALICIVAYLLSYLIKPNRGLPLIYIVRAIILVQTTALLYFALIPTSFPQELESYMANNLFMGVMLLALIPWILGATFYIFDFPIRRKILFTLLNLAFFIIALPLQYLLHVNLIALGSLLFMPILYLVFGLFIDVMAFVALYSYGMTRRSEIGRQSRGFNAVKQVWGTAMQDWERPA